MFNNKKFKNLLNKTFGRLKVLKLNGRTKNGLFLWLVQCQCPQKTIFSIQGISLTRKYRSTKSCGCLQKEIVTYHGMVGTRFHRIWNHMKTRVADKNQENYGGRGITVCERWDEFINFKEDMYDSYLKHVKEFGEKNTSLDRFPNQDGNYEPSNFRWATRKEQARNTRMSSITINYQEHKKWKQYLSTILNNLVTCNFNSKCQQYFGCTDFEFKDYIESLFKEGMTWENHGRGIDKWQFDHITGCNNFDLSKEQDRLECFHYTNIKPIWYKDHLIKNKQRISNEQ